jgi:hypothetical protein
MTKGCADFLLLLLQLLLMMTVTERVLNISLLQFKVDHTRVHTYQFYYKRSTDFFLRHYHQTGSGHLQDFRRTRNGVSFIELSRLEPEADRLPSSISKLRMCGTMPPPTYAPSCCGA